MDASVVSIGATIAGRYRVVDVLGEGGMGAVYGVIDGQTGRSLAVKILLDASGDHVKRFDREVKATMRIQSDHVVRVVDVGSIDERNPFMVIERLEGDTLKGIVDRGPLPPWLVADLFLQACEGLGHAHALGIVHRDVKPSNLFVLAGREWWLKILDFGISRMTTYEAYEAKQEGAAPGGTDSAAFLGSPQYTSPEQLQNPASVDERADIWSLGVSMYYALTGALPFTGSSLSEVLTAVMSKPAPLLRGALGPVVARCLQRSLDARYRRVSDLAEALAPLGTPARAALLPAIRARAATAELIVAPVPPTKLRDPSERRPFDDFEQKSTVQDLRSYRPPPPRKR